jgi:hypothetical protein
MTNSVEIFRHFLILQGKRINLLQLEIFYYTRKWWQTNVWHQQNYNLYGKNEVLSKKPLPAQHLPHIHKKGYILKNSVVRLESLSCITPSTKMTQDQ